MAAALFAFVSRSYFAANRRASSTAIGLQFIVQLLKPIGEVPDLAPWAF
jgi:hypothetical protein